MGGCCVSERPKDFLEEKWYSEQPAFDFLTFRSLLRKVEYEQTQSRLNELWSDFTPLGPLPPSNVLREERLKTTRRRVWKGVPFARIRGVLEHICSFDESLAKATFTASLSGTEVKSYEPLNRSRVSALLTESGIVLARTIECVLLSRHADIRQCVALPRVLQLLLWVGNGEFAAAIVEALLCSSRREEYFPTARSAYELLYRQILQAVLRSRSTALRCYFSKKLLVELICDMLNNLMLDCVRAEYFGCVLGLFIGAGMKGVAQCVAAMISAVAASALGKVDWTASDTLKRDMQCACKEHADFLSILASAEHVDLEAEETEEPPTCAQFLPTSSTLQSTESRDFVLSFLPEDTQSLHRVYQASARVLGELYAIWRRCEDPQLLLVRINAETVLSTQLFALYLDRGFRGFLSESATTSDSCLALVEPKPRAYRQKGAFRVQLSPCSDIEFVDEQRWLVLESADQLRSHRGEPYAVPSPSLSSVKN